MVYECGLRLTARFKSGGPSLGRSPGAHKQRRPVNQDQIQYFGEIGSTQFLEQGLRPALFFEIFFRDALFRSILTKNQSPRFVLNEADMPTNLIQHSFELAAARCEDLTPLVYRRLFREHPEAEPMFRREENDLVKGSMLALTIDAMLDHGGDRTGSFRMISCEVLSHDAYGTPRELFGKFFGVIGDTIHELLGAEWSPDIDEAWRTLLGELEGVVRQNQT